MKRSVTPFVLVAILVPTLALAGPAEDKGLEILSVLEDISDRKEAETALLESEEKFRALFESSPMGIHVYRLEKDNRLIFTDANAAADEMLGMKHERFFGKTIEEAFPSHAYSEIPARYAEVCRTGENWHTSQVDYQDERIEGYFSWWFTGLGYC